MSAPNAGKTDGPFATLERARDEIRGIKNGAGLPAGGVVVKIRGGLYEMARQLELTAGDSGLANAPIIYQSAKGEEVRLSAGKLILTWTPVTDTAILTQLDVKVRDKIYRADLKSMGLTEFGSAKSGGLELFFNNKPMPIARWPNEGFVRIVDVVGGQPMDVRGTKGDKIGKFTYDGNRPRIWAQEKDIWLHGYWFWDWSDERERVDSIDTEKQIISLAPPYHGYGYRKGQWFYAYNLLSEIDSPGEWYLDRANGILYFYPPSPIANSEAIVSVAKNIIKMTDVSYLHIQGITLEAARETAVLINGGTQDRIAGCLIRNCGGWAIKVAGGQNHSVIDCDICDTGEGGISLSGGECKTLTPAGHYAENNHIHHYSRWNRMYQPAIAISGVGIRASHNLIHDAPHEAIAFWGNDHLIEFNEIYSVCTEANDAGAIYAGRDWTMRGTVIRYNYLHNIYGFGGTGCVGVYLDDMYCGTRISGNVFYQVTRAAFIGGGRDNVVDNNIFADCQPALHIDDRAMGWAHEMDATMKERLDAMPYQQPPWAEHYPELVHILADEPSAPKGNVVTRNICFKGKWDEVSSGAAPLTKFENNLIDTDPGFVNYAKHNFQIKDDSPAYKQGFERIPVEKIGLQKDEFRTSLPTTVTEVPPLNQVDEDNSPEKMYESLYARSDWTKIDSHEPGNMAWGNSYTLSSNIAMFEATRDTIHLDRFVNHFDKILLARDSVLTRTDVLRNKIMPSWGTGHYTNGKWTAWIVHAGMLTYPAATFVRLVKENQFLAAKYGAKADEYLAVIETIVNAYNGEWRDGPAAGEGHYYFTQQSKECLPLNQQNALGRTFVQLYAVTGNAGYLDKATKLAAYFKNRLETAANGAYVWQYFGGSKGVGEDISHAAINADFAALCYDNKIVFTYDDMTKFAATFVNNIVKPDGTFAQTVDGKGTADKSFVPQLGRWLALSRFDRRIYKTVLKDLQENAVNRTLISLANLVNYD